MTQRIDLKTLPDYIAHIQLCQLINSLREKKKIVIIAGAGMSASAGIPTFDTISAKYKGLFEMSIYNNSAATALLNKILCQMYHQIRASSPTQFHLIIAALAEEGRLQRLYTQNIDGIDTQLPPLKTLIPLPEEKPWPKTIQLYGDLSTIRCETYPSTHLSRFDPALFSSGPLPYCSKCEKDEQLNEGKRRSRPIPVMRPRIWMYDDLNYPDIGAIDKVRAADFAAKPDAVIVVGTALKVPGAKIFARDMCRTVRGNRGFTAWINQKAPSLDLDCLDLVVEGDCESVAMHVSSWWLKECPNILSDSQIQNLQDKCKLFITKSPEDALNRALAEVNSNSLSKILQQQENKSRVLNIKERGKLVFISAARPQPSGSSNWKAVNDAAMTVVRNGKDLSPAPKSTSSESSGVLPNLPDCWEMEMSKRLSAVIVRETEKGLESSSVVTTISNLGYQHEAYLSDSLWRLKPGEWLNDDIINSYLELLRGSIAVGQSIEPTGILQMKLDSPWRTSQLIQIGKYLIFVPINNRSHWTFAVITSEKKGDPVHWEYYDSLGGGPPQKFLNWFNSRFANEERKRVNSIPNPKQKNSADYGLFVLIGIRLISAGRHHLSQTQSEVIIPTFRQRVLAELLASGLNPSSAQYEEFRRKEAHANTILSEVNSANKTREGSISTDSSVLSVLSRSPSPIQGFMEDTEMVSSNMLDESEEEFIQVKSSHLEKKNPERIASTFAEEASMIKMLKEAILIERASQNQTRNPNMENIGLADLWFMISTEKRALKQRHIHYEFSRQFWAEMKKLNRVPHQRGPVPKATISKVMSKLKVTTCTNWKYIIQLARRASVWTELAEIFKDHLDHPSVVLCAVPDATYTLETMTVTNRKLFFDIICSTLKTPGNVILARLKAADALYWALMHHNLPAIDLPIEAYDKDLPFEEAVSIR